MRILQKEIRERGEIIMGFFTKDVSEEELKRLKEKRAELAKELELREEIAKEEKALASEERKIKELKTAKWFKSFR